MGEVDNFEIVAPPLTLAKQYLNTTGNGAKTTLGAPKPISEQTVLEVEKQRAIEIDDGGGGGNLDGELAKIHKQTWKKAWTCGHCPRKF